MGTNLLHVCGDQQVSGGGLIVVHRIQHTRILGVHNAHALSLKGTPNEACGLGVYRAQVGIGQAGRRSSCAACRTEGEPYRA